MEIVAEVMIFLAITLTRFFADWVGLFLFDVQLVRVLVELAIFVDVMVEERVLPLHLFYVFSLFLLFLFLLIFIELGDNLCSVYVFVLVFEKLSLAVFHFTVHVQTFVNISILLADY